MLSLEETTNIHEYFGIDPEIIWKIITTDLHVLKLELNLINNQLA